MYTRQIQFVFALFCLTIAGCQMEISMDTRPGDFIDDAEENEWIVDTFGSSTEFWIGLTDEVDESKWLWVNDSDLLYKNWAKGEPDNYRKTQHHVIMNKRAAKGSAQPGKWNDVDSNEIKIGIVEVAR